MENLTSIEKIHSEKIRFNYLFCVFTPLPYGINLSDFFSSRNKHSEENRSSPIIWLLFCPQHQLSALPPSSKIWRRNSKANAKQICMQARYIRNICVGATQRVKRAHARRTSRRLLWHARMHAYLRRPAPPKTQPQRRWARLRVAIARNPIQSTATRGRTRPVPDP